MIPFTLRVTTDSLSCVTLLQVFDLVLSKFDVDGLCEKD
jgi:hypothetical protein